MAASGPRAPWCRHRAATAAYRGVHLSPSEHKSHRLGWDWTQALVLNIVALWRVDDPDPWLLVTDSPASLARCTEYRHRTWEAALFRDLKSFGWQWQASRVRQPERVERLLLVLALATLWMVALAQRVLRRGWRPLLEEGSRRCDSHFQLGLRWLKRCLTNDRPVQCPFFLWKEHMAPLKLS